MKRLPCVGSASAAAFLPLPFTGHCRDKEDLFDQLVSPAVERIDIWLEAHINRYINEVESSDQAGWKDSKIDMMRDIIYPNMEEYRLLLTRAQGTRYKNFLHDLTESRQERLLTYMPIDHSNVQ